MKYLITDTETIGLHPPAAPASGVVEVAYLEIDPHTLEIKTEFVSRVNPEALIHPEASKVHGIYEADVMASPKLLDVFNIAEPTINLGHNSAFDVKFLSPGYQNLVGSFCTLACSRMHIKNTTNHKLGTLADELGLVKGTAHSALGDVHTTRNLLKYLVEKTGRTFLELLAAQRKPKVYLQMPFGKHKGDHITTLPLPYVRWFLEQNDIDQDLRYSLQQTLKARA